MTGRKVSCGSHENLIALLNLLENNGYKWRNWMKISSYPAPARATYLYLRDGSKLVSYGETKEHFEADRVFEEISYEYAVAEFGGDAPIKPDFNLDDFMAMLGG